MAGYPQFPPVVVRTTVPYGVLSTLSGSAGVRYANDVGTSTGIPYYEITPSYSVVPLPSYPSIPRSTSQPIYGRLPNAYSTPLFPQGYGRTSPQTTFYPPAGFSAPRLPSVPSTPPYYPGGYRTVLPPPPPRITRRAWWDIDEKPEKKKSKKQKRAERRFRYTFSLYGEQKGFKLPKDFDPDTLLLTGIEPRAIARRSRR